MSNEKPRDVSDSFEKALQDLEKGKYILRLYVSGNTAKSAKAILNLRRICEQHLGGRYTLDVIDIHQQPGAAREDQVVATPTLVKSLPLPMRRIIGDLAETERILVGLNIQRVDE